MIVHIDRRYDISKLVKLNCRSDRPADTHGVDRVSAGPGNNQRAARRIETQNIRAIRVCRLHLYEPRARQETRQVRISGKGRLTRQIVAQQSKMGFRVSWKVCIVAQVVPKYSLYTRGCRQSIETNKICGLEILTVTGIAARSRCPANFGEPQWPMQLLQ